MEPLEAFMAGKAEFDRLLGDLRRASEEHFGINPEEVTEANVEAVNGWNAKLQTVFDAYIRTGLIF